MKSALNKSEEFENYYQMLGNSKGKLFETMKDVFMLALVIGYLKDSKRPFSRTGGEPIKLTIFDDYDKNIMDIIALDKKKDTSILINEEQAVDEKYRIMEEYANGGMEILVNSFCKPIPSIEKLKEFVESYENNFSVNKKLDIAEMLANAINELDE